MSELHVFSNQEFGKVRSLMIEDEPWFVGVDAARALAYADPAKALKAHVDNEDKHLVRVGEIPTLRVNNYGAYIVNESGLYSLIFSSKLHPRRRSCQSIICRRLVTFRRSTVPNLGGCAA